MKLNYKVSKSLLIALLFLIPFHASSEQVKLRLAGMFTSTELQLVRGGSILTYARIDGKGEASTGGFRPSFPGGTGKIDVNPAGYSVASVEKAFFKGDISEWHVIFRKLGDYASLRGMQYYSLSDGVQKTLVTESWISGSAMVTGTADGKRSSANFTIRDNRLGTIPFRGEVYGSSGVVFSSAQCSGSVTRFGMKIFEPGDYRVFKFFIYDRASGGWFYCSVQLMMVRSGIMRTLDLLKPENICNRVRGETIHLLGLMGHSRGDELAAFR